MERGIIQYQARAHEAEASRVLGAAFRDDPAILYLIRRDDEATSTWCLLQGIRLAAKHGEGQLATSEGKILGAAFWVPPGVSPVGGTIEQLRLGGWEAPFQIGLGGLVRELARQDDLARRVRQSRAKDAWYLDLLGVHPDAQGKGVGRLLLEPMLERIDRDGGDVVLVTYKRTNVDYYRRFGFEVESDETKAGLPQGWTMRRAGH